MRWIKRLFCRHDFSTAVYQDITGLEKKYNSDFPNDSWFALEQRVLQRHPEFRLFTKKDYHEFCIKCGKQKERSA